MKKPSVRKTQDGWWFLEIPDINYRGGWYDWTTCMVGLRLYYQANDLQRLDWNFDLNRVINKFISAHTYDGYYQYSIYDWNRR